MDRGQGLWKQILDGLGRRLGMAIAVCDREDRIRWSNETLIRNFRGMFSEGSVFTSRLERNFAPDEQSQARPAFERVIAPGEVLRFRHPDGRLDYYRHIEFEIAGDEAPLRVHCLVDAGAEKRLEDSFLSNLHQLRSMKEIIDILYESLSTQEVLYLILVAVTAHMGFGFNRAFYLEAAGGELSGRIGIGPSSSEDAHRIWTRLATLNLPTLRALYEDLTRNGQPPDPHTQSLATAMRFRLEGSGGLACAVEHRKPAILRRAEAEDALDRALFELLKTEEVAVVPLYVRNKLAGVLLADNFITRKPISEHDINVLKTFSGYAGVALERSQLYDELRESVSKLQAANETLKSHQQKLLQAEKLSAIGELAACVSHEIRNPLVAIGGLARSLEKEEGLSPSAREAVQVITTEVRRLEKFLRETLDFVKPEAVATEPADLRAELETLAGALEPEIEAAGVRMRLDLPAEPVRCALDRDLFHRAVSNLVKNAIEAAGEGGRVEVSCRTNGRWAKVRVADSGPGIPESLRARVFEPFFTTKPQGTGLGLAIANQSIRSLGGTITIEGNDEFRTIFQVTLPLEETAVRPDPGEREEKKGEEP